VTLSLSGPGVPGTRQLAVRGLPPAVFDAISEANQAFPAGIDTFLVTADGKVAGLPRSVRIDTEVLT
jgi:alpha-D-ribose 1-methylphosphonate 5-triphosphate synthase subunit PhnH